MFFTRDFRVNLSMLGQNSYISNKGLLSILQDIAEMHSSSIGHGVTDIYKTNYSWALLNWKVQIISRPKYSDVLTIKTWSRESKKLYCYRDFEILNSDGDTIAIATSKWVLIDIKTGKIAKIDDSMMSLYEPENKAIFGTEEIDKLVEPDNYLSTIDYVIRKADIDVNNHVNNLCYIDIALEAFPGTTNEFNSCNEFEIVYRRQIKFDDNILVNYTCENNVNYVVIKSSDNNVLHSIIKFN